MNEEQFGKYLKVLMQTNISGPFQDENKKIFDTVMMAIKDEIVSELKFIENIEGKDRYAIKLIVSLYSIVNIYNANYIYLENELEIEKTLKTNGEDYTTFKVRTPDINNQPIYTIVSLDKNRGLLTFLVENNYEDFTKIIIYTEKDVLTIEIYSQTEIFQDSFGKQIKSIKLKEGEFKEFIQENETFLYNHKKKIELDENI